MNKKKTQVISEKKKEKKKTKIYMSMPDQFMNMKIH